MITPAPRTTRSYGVLAQHTKDQIYLVKNGNIFASPWVVTQSARFSASILLTVKYAPFELTMGGHAERHQAAVVKPLVPRHLRAENVQLVSLQLSPSHPHYRRFRPLPRPGHLVLDRNAYAEFDAELEVLYRGKLTIDAASQLFERIVAVTARYLPRVKPADPRMERALQMLQDNPHYPLKDLATKAGLSYDRMSHLFADVVGLPLRSYLLWKKLRTAASLFGSGLTLTEIALAAGFTDSSHLSNAWQQAYGAPPSYFLYSGCVEIHTANPAERYPLPRAKHAACAPPRHVPAESVSSARTAGVCHHCGSPLETEPGS